jgi:flavodoxin I
MVWRVLADCNHGDGAVYGVLKKQGAEIVGEWSTEGYDFKQSESVVGDNFVGPVIDHGFQWLLTDERIKIWRSR